MTELRQKMIRAMELKNLSPTPARLSGRRHRAFQALSAIARAITKEMIEDYLLSLKTARAPTAVGWCSPTALFLHPRDRRKTARRLPHA